jgi:hypothetical protein
VPTSDSHTATLPVGSIHQAVLDVQSGTSAVRITTADLPGDLLTATTSGDSDLVPSLSTGANNNIALQLSSVGGGGRTPALSVVLSRSVTWSVFLDGGATSERVDLRGVNVDVVDIGAGVSRARITMPRPVGTDLLRLTAGASRLVIGVPRGVATRVAVKGGASSVRIGSVTHTGIGAPVTYDSHGYAGASDRDDLEIESGVSALVVRPY